MVTVYPQESAKKAFFIYIGWLDDTLRNSSLKKMTWIFRPRKTGVVGERLEAYMFSHPR